jgi:dipeptidyl aminopeptidase/acylaminoacyl peptidase
MIKVIWIFLVLVLLLGGFSFSTLVKKNPDQAAKLQTHTLKPTKSVPLVSPTVSSLAIDAMRQKSYPGSPITIEQTLAPGTNYNRYVVSYKSDGLKIYGLLTIPTGQKPANGWPVMLFNHGYIPPASYSTISSYSNWVASFAAAGYIVFKPDYRGNGNSEGLPTQPYITPDDVTDSMNALASVKKLKEANPQKIGVFGHSMGGNITLHELVITQDIKAAELMAGVVGNETMLANWWDHRYAVKSIVGNDLDTYYIYEQMIKVHGSPSSNPIYWDALDPTQFVSSISSPVQIQVGSADEDVPPTFSSSLNELLQKSGKVVDYHVYVGADHNLVPSAASALSASIAFFNKYLK